MMLPDTDCSVSAAELAANQWENKAGWRCACTTPKAPVRQLSIYKDIDIYAFLEVLESAAAACRVEERAAIAIDCDRCRSSLRCSTNRDF